MGVALTIRRNFFVKSCRQSRFILVAIPSLSIVLAHQDKSNRFFFSFLRNEPIIVRHYIVFIEFLLFEKFHSIFSKHNEYFHDTPRFYDRAKRSS